MKKNYCTIYSLEKKGKELPLMRARTKTTLHKWAKKLGLNWYTINTWHISEGGKKVELARKDMYGKSL